MQEYCSGLLCPPSGYVSDPGIEPMSSALAGGFFYHWFHLGSPYMNPFSSKLPSYPGCHVTLSRVLCAINRSLWMMMFWSFSILYVKWRYKFLPCLIHRMFSRMQCNMKLHCKPRQCPAPMIVIINTIIIPFIVFERWTSLETDLLNILLYTQLPWLKTYLTRMFSLDLTTQPGWIQEPQWVLNLLTTG